MHYHTTISALITTLLITGCSPENQNEIHFATSALYPPFEYSSQGELIGFDIDLAKLVAKELGKKAVFDNMQFSTVLPAITSGKDDAAIATITITADRMNSVDFTVPYYFEGMAAVYKSTLPVKNISQLTGKKMAAQLGSVMDIWLKTNYPEGKVTSLNTNNQAVEALLGGTIDVVLMDGAQGAVYSQKHPELAFTILKQAENGYGIALKKNSPLTPKINKALKKLEAQGDIATLKSKWLGKALWNN